MKKFLSLVLALVMTMSLVTISAGATEYKDLTDKDEITYEEAVAVLNKLGIITGYEDGSFKPTGNLTRGAAAKIIVSLMIGPEAANALTVTVAPYKDVPVDNTFAPYISYCKTAGYINGYTDGTFRPSGSLTGYAFAKMLLGALGYRGDIEGFTGNGWTMVVAKLGSKAGLYNGFATAFGGNSSITREQACQLALNTLKATEVEYDGSNVSVTGPGINVEVGNNQYKYVTSNNDKINHNIKGHDSQQVADYMSLEFGEEHFPDLVLDNVKYNHDIEDAYGRPANQWSLKNVKIGTYAKTANFTFTAAPSGDTSVDKVKDMGLKDYSFVRGADTGNSQLTVNGESRDSQLANGATTLTANANTLAKYAKNGALVEIYLDEDNANIISHIAVTETQIMQVNRVSSGDVTLKKVEDQGVANSDRAVAVNAVEDDDALYNVLKDLKSDDYVVVTPLWNGTTWDVDAVYVPTTATGSITKVKVNSQDNNTSGVTVGGTDYGMSKNWTAEDAGDNRTGALNGTSVTTRQESTVYIDAYGYAIYVSNVKASTNYFMFDELYSNVVNGRIHYFAQGWDTKGNEVSLDFGTSQPSLAAGRVYAYKVASSNSNADYQLDSVKQANVRTKTSAIAASDTSIDGFYFTSGVKFVFPTWENGEITGATIKDGAQKVASSTYQYVLNDDATKKITAVFLADDKDVEVSQNVLYVQKQTAVTQDADGKDVSVFTGYIDGVKHTDLVANKKVADNAFYTYSVNEATGIYTVNAYSSMTDKATSVVTGASLDRAVIKSNAYVDASNLVLSNGTPLNKNLNLSNATVIDLREGGTLSSAKDMAEGKIGTADITNYTVSLVYNDSSNSSNQGRVQYLFITNATTSAVTTRYTAKDTANGVLFSLDKNTWSSTVAAAAGTTVYFKVENTGITVSSVKFGGSSGTDQTLTDGIGSFAMPANDYDADSYVVGFEVTAGYYDSKAGKVNFDGKAYNGGSAPTANDLMLLAKDFLEGEHYTVTLNLDATAGTYNKMTVVKDGVSQEIAVADVNVSASNITVTVDGVTKVLLSSAKSVNDAKTITGTGALVNGAYQVKATSLADGDVVTGDYVAVSGFNATPTAFSTAITNGNATLAVTGAPTYVAVGGTLEVILTVKANAAATAKSDATLTATSGTIAPSAAQEITQDATKAGTTVKWTVTAGNNDITAVTVAIAD